MLRMFNYCFELFENELKLPMTCRYKPETYLKCQNQSLTEQYHIFEYNFKKLCLAYICEFITNF